MRSIPIPPSNLNTHTTTNTLAPSSPWHSPIPYLFGGLAAIMALIALALLMLACSYWRLTRQGDSESNNNNNNNVKEGGDDSLKKEHPMVYDDNILVIMAGDHKPTFLATPSSSLVGTNSHKHLGNSEISDKSQKEIVDKSNHVVVLDAAHENGSSQHEQHGH